MSSPGKYRGLRVDNKGKIVQEIKQDNTVGNMPFIYGDKFEIDGKVYIVSGTATVEDVDGEQMLYGFAEVHPETVGQSTGLNDKKRTEEFPSGQPVCERDIVESVWQVDHKTKIVGQVKYYSTFALWSLMDSKGDMVSPCWNECEVIGNIHEKREAL